MMSHPTLVSVNVDGLTKETACVFLEVQWPNDSRGPFRIQLSPGDAARAAIMIQACIIELQNKGLT